MKIDIPGDLRIPLGVMGFRSSRESDVRKEFGRSFRRFLASRGMTAESAARELGIRSDAVAAYASGEKLPSTMTLLTMARKLGSTVSEMSGF